MIRDTTDDPVWRYLFYELLSGKRIGIFSVADVQCDLRLSDIGSFSGSLAIPNAAMADSARQIIAQRTAVVALRAPHLGEPFEAWWGGIVWGNPVQSGVAGSASMSISASSFESFLGRGILEVDLPDALQQDQLDIARTLWQTRQARINANIGVTYGTELSGVLRDRTEYKKANALNLGDQLDNLANVNNGFEYQVQVYLDANGNPALLLRLGYPQFSPVGPQPFFSLSRKGGRLLSYTDTPDGTAGDTVFYARGSAAQDETGNVAADVAPPVSAAQKADALLAAGWPRLVRMDDYSSVSDIATLNEHAQAKRALFSGATDTFTPVVSVVGADWTPAMLGATHRFRIDDVWYGGQELSYRVVGCTLHPPTATAAETVDLVVETNADEDRPDFGAT